MLSRRDLALTMLAIVLSIAAMLFVALNYIV